MDKFNKMLASGEPMVLSIFRIVVGLLLFQYGIAKIFKFPVLPYFANIPPLITTAGALELILGALLIVGLFTRYAAFVLSGEMAFVFFMGYIFKEPPPAGIPPPSQRRHRRDPVLLPLPVSRLRRRRSVE